MSIKSEIGTPRACVAIKNGKVVKRYSSMSEAAQDVGGQVAGVCNTCTGRQKTHRGFEWRYADEEEQ